VLFKTYNPTAGGNNADVILMYLTVFMQHCLRDIQKVYNMAKGKVPAKDECEKIITKLVKEAVLEFDDSKNFLPTFEIKGTPTSNDKSAYKKYMMALKEEAGKRLLLKIYDPTHGTMDAKYWLSFGRHKFCGMKFNNSL
jgi:hypothetical protein